MSKNSKIILIIVATLIGLGLLTFILSSGEDPLQSNQSSITPTDNTSQKASNGTGELEELDEMSGSYVDYSEAKFASTDGTRVLFFHASWCPTCKALDQNIRAGVVPGDLTIFKVNYDTENDLIKKHGVTYQHTLVQVDDDGEQLHKWAGSYTIKQIEDELI